MNRKRAIAVLLLILLVCTALFAACSSVVVVALYSENELFGSATLLEGEEYSLDVPTRTGYQFLGWYDSVSDKALTDSSGTSAGLTWSQEYSSELYAMWNAKNYELVFDYNGATGNNSVTSTTVTYDTDITYGMPVPTKTSNSFVGWATDTSGTNMVTDSSGQFLSAKQTFTADNYKITADQTTCTLYAIWGKMTTTINFVTNGGSSVDSITVEAGEVIDSLPSTAKNNYAFVTWCLDSTLLSTIQLPYQVSDNPSSSLTLYAQYKEATSMLVYTGINNDKEYKVSYSGYDLDIVVPDMYYDKTITAVDYIYAPNATSIILPDTITTLSSGAFANLVNLTNIKLPSTLQAIPSQLFSGCINLTSFDMPLGVTSIGSGAFASCSSIEYIYIGEYVYSIGDGAFSGMSSLSEFDVSVDNTSYSSIDGVLYKTIGVSLQLIQYPANKEGDEFTIVDGTTKVNSSAFSGANLQQINIGAKVSTIGDNAFENCTNLMNVIFDNNTASSITIGNYAFSGCTALKSVQIYTEVFVNLGTDVFYNTNDTYYVYVLSDKYTNYIYGENWRAISSRIDTVSSIYGDYAIEEYLDGYSIRQYLGNDAVVVIPSIINGKLVVKIGQEAFSYNKYLTEVTISSCVQVIEAGAFYNCYNLSTVIMLPDSPPQIDSTTFAGVSTSFVIYIDNTYDVLMEYMSANIWKQYSIYTKI